MCINSQTPPLRFKLGYSELLEKYGQLDDPLDYASLEEGVDYEFSPGGVTAMMQPLLREMEKGGYVTESVWIGLGVNYPPRVKMGRSLVVHVEVDEHTLKRYTRFKELLWSEIHGTGSVLEHGFPKEDYDGFVKYNTRTFDTVSEFLDQADVFYIQDFQQLLQGLLLGPSAPAILRWHVPFRPENLSRRTRWFVIRAMEGFDAVVVSTRRDLEGLLRSRYAGKAFHSYPFVDPSSWRIPGASEVQEFRDKRGLKQDDRMLLLVARMDRIKSQDVAIRALARLRTQNVKLVLVGNGSFSSSPKGGLGSSKAGSWRSHLEGVAREAGVRDRVSFLSYVPKADLECAYQSASLVLLTSKIEGFGLAVLEGWLYSKPVVVSSGAGVSELVVEGSNGYVFSPGDDRELASKLELALAADDRIGQNGYETAKQCHLERVKEKEKEILEDVIKGYG